MHLPRHTIESHAAVPLFRHASFCSPHPASLDVAHITASGQKSTHVGAGTHELAQPAIFSCASLNGFMVSQTDPLKLVSNRTWSSSQGGLSHAVPVQHTSLLFLVGGGRVPRFSPNKVILWDEAAEYTATPPRHASRNADSDDDDDLTSAPSRRASTIFSAGSEFEAYGKPSPDDFDRVGHTAAQDGRADLSDDDDEDLRHSTSSLVDAVHSHRSRSSFDVAASSDPDLARKSSLEESFGSSSLGIGRLQTSHDPNEAIRHGTASLASLDASTDLASSSFHSHAILSSSADLADPFADDDHDSTRSRLPTASQLSTTQAAPSDKAKSTQTSSSSHLERPTRKSEPGIASQGLFSSQSTRQTGANLVDSVSSMATTATNATAKPAPEILHGREVAELEFSQAVRGIYASSIFARPSHQSKSGSKGKARDFDKSASPRKPKLSHFCVVLVVVLESKTLVFELSPPSMVPGLGGKPASSSWTIHKRTAVHTYRNPKGLGSVAPHYGEATTDVGRQASAVVAIPGRQKGHIQLLNIKVHSAASASAAAGAAPALSNPTSSLGAASIIVAHESSLAAITLSPDARFLATASSKGTLIRIWSNNLTAAGADFEARKERTSSQGSRSSTPGRTGFGTRLVRELRRGTDPATILSIAFSPDASLIAAASDKGTIHIFLLDTDWAVAQSDAGKLDRSLSPSSSRTAHLGRVAAQFLPSGIGNLAGQIPPSVLPQYLKSEWSSAQFRIPLKTFGASSRHYNAPPATEEGGLYGTGFLATKPAGTEKSTEGAWAQMRSRISDIRKGEANVEESIFLCWILEASPPSAHHPAMTTVRASATDKDCLRTDKARSRGASEPSGHVANPSPSPGINHRLIALTTSGGWYKLAVNLASDNAENEARGSTVLDMYRRDGSAPAKGANALECQLVEYRPMAALLDGWRL